MELHQTGNGFCYDNDGVYTGMGTLIASGTVKDTKENMYCMLHNTGMTYLKGLGVKDSTLWDLSGGDRSDESSSNG